MKVLPSNWALFTSLLAILLVVGCDPGKKPSGDGDGHDHDHGHSHSHASTLHGGHLIELVNKTSGAEEEFHAEWNHEDKIGKVTVYVLDSSGKKDHPIPAAELNITVTIKGKEPTEYQLPAINQSEDDPPTTARFETIDPELLTSLNFGEGVESVLTVEIDGTTYEGKIEYHDHGHKH